MPRTVFAASATAFSAALAKLSLEVPTTSITFCAICSSPLILIQFGLYCWTTASPPPPAVQRLSLRLLGIRRTIGRSYTTLACGVSVEHASVSHRQTTFEENHISGASATLDRW